MLYYVYIYIYVVVVVVVAKLLNIKKGPLEHFPMTGPVSELTMPILDLG